MEEAYLVNFSYKGTSKLLEVSSENSTSPSYEDFVRCAKTAFAIEEGIIFSNDCGSMLDNSRIFMIYVRKFHDSPTFKLNINILPDNFDGLETFEPVAKRLRTTSPLEEPALQSISEKFGNEADTAKNSTDSSKLPNHCESAIVEESAYPLSPNISQIVEYISELNSEIPLQDDMSSNVFVLSTETTETVPKLDVPVHNSPIAKDIQRTSRFLINSPLSSREAAHEVDRNDKLTKFQAQDLRNFITQSDGDDIFKEYEEKQHLSTAMLKKFIHIVVEHLITEHTLYPGSHAKAHYAQLCTTLLPKYKTSSSIGYDFFYDPISRTGKIDMRLKRRQELQRSTDGKGKYYTKKMRERDARTKIVNEVQDASDDDYNQKVEQNKDFLRNASILQKDEIMKAWCYNLKDRERNYDDIIPTYKEVLVLMPSLLAVDFDMRHGIADIQEKWMKMWGNIDSVYSAQCIRKKKLLDPYITDWAPGIQNGLKLMSLFPPVNRDASRTKGTTVQAVKSLVLFFPLGKPPSELINEMDINEGNPQLFVVGANKRAVSGFFLRVNQLILKIPAETFHDALEFQLKVHYALDLEYRGLHAGLFQFMQHYLFKLPLQKLNSTVKNAALSFDLQSFL